MEPNPIEKMIPRINELTRLSRERALTDEELAERARLRADYAAAFRRSLEGELDRTYVLGEDGVKRKLNRKED